ncbi:MAG: asparagine synthase (glutamine-hydrolyzing) [Candidatus Latescibacterota bacterium]|nr:MAG: asparagine synthase (glutamine-hydrolyzing) [Candidatus Latescibacterota bacterium]
MCGIAGMIDISGRHAFNPRVLDRMVDALYLRGPDDRGTSIRPPVAMGMRRLSIIDVEGGHQPIENEDGTVRVVQNGEIYSFPQLRTRLIDAGHRFKTRSDTEVLVHGYEEWGLEGLLAQLNGMYAFALQDERSDSVYLVRDRLGIKPLLYSIRDGVLYFGSGLAALFASGMIPAAPDPIGVRLYLQLQFIPGPFTAVSGVKKLRPASYLAVENGRVRGPIEYWGIPGEDEAPKHFDDWVEELRELLTDAVRSHLVSDVEVGLFLSGGVDSSTALGLMSKYAEQPVSAFSIGFEERAGFDETHFVRIAAERFGAKLYHTYFTPSHVFDLAQDVVAHIDEPLGDPACLPTFLLASEARRHVKVVLSGEGADELFAGYGYYQRVGSVSHRLKQILRNGLDRGFRSSRARGLAKRFKHRSLISGYPYALSPGVIEHLLPDLPSGLMSDIHDTTLQLEQSLLPAHGKISALGRALRVDGRCYLPDDLLMKVDRMTMAHSLEARVPFLDYRIVELAMRMPSSAKIKNGRNKAVLRSAFADLIGDAIAERDKHGFALPMHDWITNQLRPLINDRLTPHGLRDCPWLASDTVSVLLDAHYSGRSRFEREIWMLYVLVSWFSQCRTNPQPNGSLREAGDRHNDPPTTSKD